MGAMMCWGFSLGGLALLMVQYCSGGKWGLLAAAAAGGDEPHAVALALMFLSRSLIFMKKLYLWAPTAIRPRSTRRCSQGLINKGAGASPLQLEAPHAEPAQRSWVRACICFAHLVLYTWRLNRWSLQRDADPEPNSRSGSRSFENISGPGIVVYSLTMTAPVIYWVMSLDVTWFSSVYGLLFLVGQGYAVLALSVITVISLSQGRAHRRPFCARPSSTIWASSRSPS